MLKTKHTDEGAQTRASKWRDVWGSRIGKLNEAKMSVLSKLMDRVSATLIMIDLKHQTPRKIRGK